MADTPTEAIERIGPDTLYGAVGVAMFKADLGGLPIDQAINFVGNAAYEALRSSAPQEPDDDALIGIVRDVLYRRFPTEVHADLLRCAAREIVDRLQAKAPETDYCGIVELPGDEGEES